MKTTSFKKTLLTGLAVLGAFTGLASAQTVIRIVGSNGDRTATQTAISKLLAPGWVYRGISGAGNTSSSGSLTIATDSNFGAWNGTYNGNAVIIKTSFTGALAGIQAVAGGQATFRFVVSDGTGNGVLVNPISGGAVLNTDYELAAADFGFSTNFQSTSPFNGLFQGVTYSPVVEEIVGVSPLGFYASPGFPGTPSSDRPSFKPNITTQLARQLYTTGALSLAQFTGDYVNDKDKIVYAIGRNTDAGQRYSAYLELGFNTNSQVKVWFPTFSTAQTTAGNLTYGGIVGTHQPWPIAQQPGGIAVPLGSGGYNSGANLAAVLTTTLGVNAYKGQYFDDDLQATVFQYPNATAGYYVGYVTPGDANNRILGNNGALPVANRGVSLSFNGVALTTGNVKNGTYTAWLYNRIIKPQSGLSGDKLTFANALRDQIATVDAPAGGGFFDDATVLVKRFTDGGDVVPK
ncbi:MAG: hypothetical protein ACOYOF_02055 [Verrucomicrobiaceae bacterium]